MDKQADRLLEQPQNIGNRLITMTMSEMKAAINGAVVSAITTTKGQVTKTNVCSVGLGCNVATSAFAKEDSVNFNNVANDNDYDNNNYYEDYILELKNANTKQEELIDKLKMKISNFENPSRQHRMEILALEIAGDAVISRQLYCINIW